MKLGICPGSAELQRHLLGRVHGQRAEELDEHLEGCSHCLVAMRELVAEDDITRAIQEDQPDIVGATSEAAAVVERIQRLQAAIDTSDSLTATHIDPLDRGGAAEAIDFLAPPQQPDELGRLGKYRVLEVIGAGGMGIVLRAEDPSLHRQVAIKVMRPAIAASRTARERFLREARAAASIEHDNIVSIYHVDEDRGIPYLAMPLLRGESLQDRIERDGIVDPAELLRIGREAAAGLNAAHGRGLVHRDVKPDNIWLEEGTGRVKILDFGLARAHDDVSGLTQGGLVIGTPLYMSPEQARGQAVDGRSDLFSLGSVLYHALAGKPPFQGSNIHALLHAVAEAPADFSGIAADGAAGRLRSIVQRLLEKTPTKRVSSTSELETLLADAMAAPGEAAGLISLGEAEATIEWPTLQSRKASRWRRVSLAAVALGMAAAIAVWTTFKVKTDRGTLVIHATGNDFETSVRGEEIAIRNVATGAETRVALRSERTAAGLAPGEYEVVVRTDSGLTTTTDRFSVTGGGESVVEVQWEPTNAQLAQVSGNPTGGRQPAAERAGGTAATTGDAGFTLTFDGKDDWVKLPLTYAGKHPITIELWANSAGPQSYRQLVLTSNTDIKGQQEFGIALFQRGDVYPAPNYASWAMAYSGRNGSFSSLAASQEMWKAGRESHIAFVAVGKKYRFFVDGKLWRHGELGEAPAHSTLPFAIGGQPPVLNGFFEGTIDEVRFSKVARYREDFEPQRRFDPDRQTMALYHCDEGQGSTLQDSSENKQHGKVMGARWTRSED